MPPARLPCGGGGSRRAHLAQPTCTTEAAIVGTGHADRLRDSGGGRYDRYVLSLAGRRGPRAARRAPAHAAAVSLSTPGDTLFTVKPFFISYRLLNRTRCTHDELRCAALCTPDPPESPRTRPSPRTTHVASASRRRQNRRQSRQSRQSRPCRSSSPTRRYFTDVE